MSESFWFRFKPSDAGYLCLWYKAWYKTWSLWPDRTWLLKGKGCSCERGARDQVADEDGDREQEQDPGER